MMNISIAIADSALQIRATNPSQSRTLSSRRAVSAWKKRFSELAVRLSNIVKGRYGVHSAACRYVPLV